VTVADWLWQALLATGFGVASAVIPVLSAEAYVLGAGVSGALDPVTAAIGISIGQTVGKIGMFLAVRYRPGYSARRHRREPRGVDLDTRRGRMIHGYRLWSKRLLDGLSDPRYGSGVTLLSSFTGLPPLYAVTLLAGASRMNVVGFGLAVFGGRAARFVLLALGIAAF
jgi:membrane protein YqaA with SNARE-associated domain